MILNLGEGLPYGSEGFRKKLAKGLIKSLRFGVGILCCHLNNVSGTERSLKFSIMRWYQKFSYLSNWLRLGSLLR